MAPQPDGEGPWDGGRERRRHQGAVIIQASRSEVYGSQRNEFWIQNGRGPIAFSDLVLESSGHKVLPINPRDRQDMLLLQHLSQAMTAFARLGERGQRFTGKSICDIGKRFEYMIAEALGRTAIDVSVLGRPGYPDCVLRQGDRVTYLEIKTSASVQKESNGFFKTFSFTSGNKIRSDARHLLLKVQMEEEVDKMWKVVAWEVRDLSALMTRLKTEFNAGLADLAGVPLLRSSDGRERDSDTVQAVLDENRGIERPRKRRKGGGRLVEE